MLILRVDPSDDRPIYAQIGDQVRGAVAAGVLRPGDMVPSVRELSKQLMVNPNTVARAYRDLQTERLLEAVRGTGLQVTDQAPARCQAERREIVRLRLRALLAEAKRCELPLDELEAIFREEWGTGNGAVDRPAR